MLPPRRMLVVDDNRDAADTLGALLEALGARVSVVHSGQEALARSTVRPRRGAARHRHAGDGRLRGGAPHPGDAGARGVLLIALTGWGQEQDYAHTAGGLRSSSRQAAGHGQAL